MDMAAFRINRTNDAVFKAVFAKHPDITLALIHAFFEFQGTELLRILSSLTGSLTLMSTRARNPVWIYLARRLRV
jgi:hypothetical protein